MTFAGLKTVTRIFPKSASEVPKNPPTVAAPKPVKIVEPPAKLKDTRLKEPTKAGARFADTDATRAMAAIREDARVRPVWFLPGVDDHDGAGLKEGSTFKAALPTTDRSERWAKLAEDIDTKNLENATAAQNKEALYDKRAAAARRIQALAKGRATRAQLKEYRAGQAAAAATAAAAAAAAREQDQYNREVREAGDRALRGANGFRARVRRGMASIDDDLNVFPKRNNQRARTQAGHAELMEHVERRLDGAPPGPLPWRPRTRAELRDDIAAAPEAREAAPRAAAAAAAKGKGAATGQTPRKSTTRLAEAAAGAGAAPAFLPAAAGASTAAPAYLPAAASSAGGRAPPLSAREMTSSQLDKEIFDMKFQIDGLKDYMRDHPEMNEDTRERFLAKMDAHLDALNMYEGVKEASGGGTLSAADNIRLFANTSSFSVGESAYLIENGFTVELYKDQSRRFYQTDEHGVKRLSSRDKAKKLLSERIVEENMRPSGKTAPPGLPVVQRTSGRARAPPHSVDF